MPPNRFIPDLLPPIYYRRKVRSNLQKFLQIIEDNISELEEDIKRVIELIQTSGDDSQLANVDLQNMLQKYEQTLTAMKNISKMLHEYSDKIMAVLRKIGL